MKNVHAITANILACAVVITLGRLGDELVNSSVSGFGADFGNDWGSRCCFGAEFLNVTLTSPSELR